MPNMMHYIDRVKDDSFYDLPPNQVDFLILSELGYLPYDQALSPEFKVNKGLSLADLAEAYFQAKGDKPFSAAACKNRINLLKKVIQTKRYKQIKALAYLDDYDEAQQKQFSAMIFRLRAGQFLLAFRGTDDSLVGWKESFHMTYMAEVPAQTAAKTYLKQAMTELDGQFHLAGHSKGGNLCLFSASHLTPALQDRISSITTYDAPGLHPSLTASTGYQIIEERVCHIIPQDSVVGQLFERAQSNLVVKSNSMGLLQHDTFTWQVQGHQFSRLNRVTKGSRQVNRALTHWLHQTKNRELQRSFDLSFNLLFNNGFNYLGDFKRLTPRRMLHLLREISLMPDKDKAMLIRLIRQFFYTYLKIVREGIPLHDWLSSRKNRQHPDAHPRD